MIPARGLRNFNPGNLTYNAYTASLGATSVEPDGAYGVGRFAVFPDMQTGIYALAKNLLNYQDRYGIRTVSQVINKWAPGNENNTQAYIAFVDGVLGCGPDDQFDFHNANFLYWACTAIGEEEVGHDEFTHGVTDPEIDAGISAALGL